MPIRFVVYPFLTFCGVLLTAVGWVYLFDLESVLTSTGLSLKQWLLIDIIWTLSGGLICWAMSRDISLWATSSLLLDHESQDIIDRVQGVAKDLGFPYRLQVATYPAKEVNVFAAGPLPSRSVISLSEGFLELPTEEQKRLLVPEILKLENGSTTLLIASQGMVYGFNLYFARVLALLLGTSFLSSEGETSSTKAEIIVSIVTTLFLTFWGSLVVSYLSRQRQKWGDKETADILGPKAAAEILSFWSQEAKKLEQNDVFTSTLKAAGPEARWKGPFATHPLFRVRQQALSAS